MPRKTIVARVLGAGACGAGVASAVCFWRGQDALAWQLHLASVCMWVLAFALPDVRNPAKRTPTLGGVLLLVSVTAVALLPRAFALGQFPEGVFVDEADNANYALRIVRESGYLPVYATWTNLPAHFLYPIAWAFSQFGGEVQVLRMTSAAWGAATVALMYALLRRWFDRPVALAVSVMLAFMRWHLTFSRLGMHGITVPFFVAALLLLADYVATQRSLRAWAWLGLVAGAALCFYVPLRLVPVLALACVYVCARGAGGVWRRREWLTGVLVFAASALLAALPFAQFAAANFDVVFRRTAEVSLLSQWEGSPQSLVLALARQLMRHAGMLLWSGDPNPRHALPEAPLLDPAMMALCALGLIAAWKTQRVPHRIAGLSVAVMLIPALLSVEGESPHALRSIGIIPGLLLFAACGLDFLKRNTSMRLFAAAAILATAASAAISTYQYFGVQRYHPAVWKAHSTMETLVARDVNALAQDHVIVLTPQLRFQPTAQYLIQDLSRVQVWSTDDPLNPQHAPGSTVALWVQPELQAKLLDAVRPWPNAEIEPLRSPLDGEIVAYRARFVP